MGVLVRYNCRIKSRQSYLLPYKPLRLIICKEIGLIVCLAKTINRLYHLFAKLLIISLLLILFVNRIKTGVLNIDKRSGVDRLKKFGLSVALFILFFAAVYLACCYLLPGFKIKLYADDLTYFLESIKYMAGLKTLISALAGLIAGTFPYLFDKFFKR